jgi:hypothetical protein
LAALQTLLTDTNTKHDQEMQKVRDDLSSKSKELENMRIQLSSAQEAVANAAAQSASSLVGQTRGPSSRLLQPIRTALGQTTQRSVPMTGRANVVKDLQTKTKQLEDLTGKNLVSSYNV